MTAAHTCMHGEERAETVAGFHSEWVCVKCGHRRQACHHAPAARTQPVPVANLSEPEAALPDHA